jgi:hypothetical protein
LLSDRLSQDLCIYDVALPWPQGIRAQDDLSLVNSLEGVAAPRNSLLSEKVRDGVRDKHDIAFLS